MARMRAAPPASSERGNSASEAASGPPRLGAEADQTKSIVVLDDLLDIPLISEREGKVIELYLGRFIDDLLRELDHSRPPLPSSI